MMKQPVSSFALNFDLRRYNQGNTPLCIASDRGLDNVAGAYIRPLIS
jgi:hypothetical protein